MKFALILGSYTFLEIGFRFCPNFAVILIQQIHQKNFLYTVLFANVMCQEELFTCEFLLLKLNLVDCLSSPGELGYNMFEKFEQLDVSNDESKNMTDDLQKQIMVLEDTITDLNKTLNDLIASLTCFS